MSPVPSLPKALHLIGQALLEEKSQLVAATADEEVAFDFSLKARGRWMPCGLGFVACHLSPSLT